MRNKRVLTQHFILQPWSVHRNPPPLETTLPARQHPDSTITHQPDYPNISVTVTPQAIQVPASADSSEVPFWCYARGRDSPLTCRKGLVRRCSCFREHAGSTRSASELSSEGVDGGCARRRKEKKIH